MTEPKRSRDASAWAQTWRRAEVSIEVADAQRDMRDRCVAEVRSHAKTLRECQGRSGYALALDALADVLASLEPRAEATGNCERGA